MTAAQRFAVADEMAAEHTSRCSICTAPDVTRPTYYRYRKGVVVETCRRGRQLADAWVLAWKRRVDALTDRRA